MRGEISAHWSSLITLSNINHNGQPEKCFFSMTAAMFAVVNLITISILLEIGLGFFSHAHVQIKNGEAQ